MENTGEYIKGRALNSCKPDSRNIFGGSSPCWVTSTNKFIAASLLGLFFFSFTFLSLTAHHHYEFHYFIV